MSQFITFGADSYIPEFTRLEEQASLLPDLSDQEFVSKVVQIVKISREQGNYDLMDKDLNALFLRHSVTQPNVVKELVQRVKESIPKTDLSMIYDHLLADLFLCPNGTYLYELPNFLDYDEDFRIACAKLEVAQYPDIVCSNIRAYGISDQMALIDIAKRLAAHESRGGVFGMNKISISKNIHRFGIQSEQARFDIAKIAAKNEKNFSEYVQNYQIETEDARIELAMNAIAYADLSFSEYVDNYAISSEGVRIDLADLVLDRFASGITSEAILMINSICRHFDQYLISRQEAIVSCAKRLSGRNAYGLWANMQNFPIESQQVRVEIAKQAARQDGTFLAINIDRFGIKSQQDLIEIAILAFERSGINVIKHLQNALDPSSKAAIFAWIHASPQVLGKRDVFFEKESFQLYPELELLGVNTSCNLSQFLFNLLERKGGAFPISLLSSLHADNLILLKEQNPETQTMKRNMLILRCSVLDYAYASPNLLKKMLPLLDGVEKNKPFVKQQQMQWLAQVMMICRTEKVPPSAFESRIQSFESLLNLKDPSLRNLITKDFIDELFHPRLDAVLQGRNIDPTIKKEQAFYFCALALSSFCSQIGPYEETVWSKKKNEPPKVKQVSFLERMHDLLSSKYFKDSEKTKSFMKNLYALAKTPKLTEKEKVRILRNILFIKEENGIEQEHSERLFFSLQSVAQIIALGQAEDLIAIRSRKQLEQGIENLYVSALHINVENFYDKFSKTFGNTELWRKPTALLTYAATLKKIGDQEDRRGDLLAFLRIFAESVLNQEFSEIRYAEGGTEHLKEIQKRAPRLLEAWQKGQDFLNEKYTVVDTDNPCDLLLCGSEVGSCQSVDHDAFFSKCLIAYLWDPKIRLMAIKNKDGVIIARCMIRLLFNENTRKFVLFQEKKYPEVLQDEYRQILDLACKKRAEQLGVALVAKDPNGERDEGITVRAFNGVAPFEYLDSNDDERPIKEGAYQIHDCYYIKQ